MRHADSADAMSRPCLETMPVPPENVIRAKLDDGSMSGCAEPINSAGEKGPVIAWRGASGDGASGRE